MIVYRVTREERIYELSGTGSKLAGGRWNFKGIPALYTSESRALAVLEVLVHIEAESLNRKFSLAEIFVPDEQEIKKVNVPGLKIDSNELADLNKLKEIGSLWMKKADSLVLQVPSAIIREEHNLLINPEHPRAGEIKILNVRPFNFDARLI